MKTMNKMEMALVAAMLLAALLPNRAGAWTGDIWGSMTRAEIQAIADEMIDGTWTPLIDMSIWQYSGSTYKYFAGTTYKGIAYTQSNPQETWQEFTNGIASASTANLGNDCSGFVSICWKLPSRRTTSTLESALGNRWISLGDRGSAATAPLLVGDALNSTSVGHVVLFRRFETTGVRTLEQTPNNAQRRTRSFSNLATYRPIRRLDLIEAPVITSQPRSAAVAQGLCTNFSISVIGTAPFYYQWWSNGVALTGGTAATNLLACGPGSYYCVVTNSFGAVTSAVATVTFQNPVVIISQPLSETNYPGANVTFTVAATGSPPLGYQWRFNTVNIPGATASSYVRTNVQFGDTGSYSVMVSNAVSAVVSSNAVLTVIAPPGENFPPMLAPINNRTVFAGSTVTFTNEAYDPNPTDVLTFSLDPGAPSAATIQPVTGAFSWTTTSADTNQVHSITVRVTDNGTPPMSGTVTFSVTVVPPPPPNRPPLLAPIEHRTVHAGNNLTRAMLAYDPDPADTLTFSLATGAPDGATIEPATGVFDWTPSDAQGNAIWQITVRVVDDGVPPLMGSATFNVTVLPRLPNLAPTLAPIGDHTVHAGSLISFTNFATDPDAGQTLGFSLDEHAPAGAELDAITGVFTWIPEDALAGTTNAVTIWVTDDGEPPLSAAATFAVVVRPRPVLETVAISANQATLRWSAIANVKYRLQYKNNLLEPLWQTLGPDITATNTTAMSADAELGDVPERYYRIHVVEELP